MNSHVNFATGIYASIISDAAARWPSLRTSLERDQSRLRRDVKARGLSYITITLPALGKAFDRMLDRGYLDPDLIPQGISIKDQRPLYLRELWNLVFDDAGVLREDADIEAVYFVRQFCYCFKKYRLECKPQYVKETLDEFFAIEAHLPEPTKGTWDDDAPRWFERRGHPLWGPTLEEIRTDLFDDHPRRSLPWDSLHALCMRVIKGELGRLPDWDLFPRHGPGATSDGQRGVVKYDFPNWPRKLNERFPFDWFGSGLIATEYVPSDREVPSKLIAVPKTQKGPRLICAEPIAHQWIQQGIWRWLEGQIEASRLLRRSICFRDQDKQRKLALSSSMDGKLATIDLSSASDRLSCRLVEYVFQGSPSILTGLHACRSRALTNSVSDDHPKMIKLRKFAPMGSACTFPIQTIVFTLLSVWALRLAESREWDFQGLEGDFERVSVFGDDIIIPTHAMETIMLVLDECGLKVNATKSYGGTNFRESCGMDAFKGFDVTPAYILEAYDGSPSSMATTIESSNNFHICGCWETADDIVSQIPLVERQRIFVRRFEEDGPLALLTFSSGVPLVQQLRWDKDLQRWYSSWLTVTSTVKKVKGTGEACLTQYFTEAPDPELPWSSGQAGRIKLRKSLVRVYE